MLAPVRAGRDATHVMYEDDGETREGTAGFATKATTWTWEDKARSLSWSTSGHVAGGLNLFTTVRAVLFSAAGTRYSGVAQSIGTSGKISFA